MDNSPQPGRNIGKVMTIMAWLFVMALLTYYFRGVEEERYNPNQAVESTVTPQFTEVKLRQNSQGHYVTTGTINQVPVTFMIDTGATFVAIPYHLKDKLQLKAGMSIPISTANGTSTSYLTSLADIGIGDIHLQGVRAGLTKGLGGDDILLGMSFLADLELIQRQDTLTIRQYRH